MKNIKTILIIIGIILLIILFISKCKPTIIGALGGYTDKDSVTKIDTVYGEVTFDTIAFKNKIREIYKDSIKVEKSIVYKWKDSTDEVVDKVRQFRVTVKDSLIEGEALLTNDFLGNLRDFEFKYKPLFPKYITKTETNTLSSPIRNRIGVGVGLNSEIYPSIHAAYITKKYLEFRVGYTKPDLIIDNPIITNDMVGITITKFF